MEVRITSIFVFNSSTKFLLCYIRVLRLSSENISPHSLKIYCSYVDPEGDELNHCSWIESSSSKSC